MNNNTKTLKELDSKIDIFNALSKEFKIIEKNIRNEISNYKKNKKKKTLSFFRDISGYSTTSTYDSFQEFLEIELNQTNLEDSINKTLYLNMKGRLRKDINESILKVLELYKPEIIELEKKIKEIN